MKGVLEIGGAKKFSVILWLHMWITFYGNVSLGPGFMGVWPRRTHLGPFPYKKKSNLCFSRLSKYYFWCILVIKSLSLNWVSSLFYLPKNSPRHQRVSVIVFLATIYAQTTHILFYLFFLSFFARRMLFKQILNLKSKFYAQEDVMSQNSK